MPIFVIQVVYLMTYPIAFAVNLYIIHLCDKQARSIVARFMAFVAMFSIGITITTLGITLAPSEQVAFFWLRFNLLLVSGLSVWSLAWVLYYLDARKWLQFPRVVLLGLLPFIQSLFGLFAPLHPLFIMSWSWQTQGLLGVEFVQRGVIFQIITIYNLIIVLLGIWMMRYRYQRVSHLINRQTAWILGGIVLSWAIGNFRVWGIVPETVPPLYSISTTLGAIFVIRGLRLSLFTDTAPIAHEHVFNNIDEHVIVLNQDNVIVDMNSIARNYLTDMRHAIGQSIHDYPHLAQALQASSGNTPTTDYEVYIDEKFYKVSLSAIYFKNTSTVLGHVLTLSDITVRKQMELERENLIMSLDAYARTVAHDLKNPVNVVGGYLELMTMAAEKESYGKLNDYLAKAIRGTRSMEDIIQSILLLATLRQNEGEIYHHIDVRQCLDNVLERLVFMIEDTQTQITVDVPLLDGRGYANWVEEVFLNYLSNAIKYGGKPPLIHIKSQPDPQNPEMIRYDVTDNGVGLMSDEQASLFEHMHRLERHDKEEGHGLGLFIVRQMVERMGGKVSVESHVGVGSTFSFTLPSFLPTEGL